MLDKALDYWQQQHQMSESHPSQQQQIALSPSVALGWCLQGLVGLKLKLGKVSEAVACYQELESSGLPHSGQAAGVLGRLIRAVAVSEPKAAVHMGKGLPAISSAKVPGMQHRNMVAYSSFQEKSCFF